MAEALAVHGVSKVFGGYRALTDVSLNLAFGSVHAVIGPNGAGKSTLAGIIAGDVRPTSGNVVLAGTDITKASVWERSRLGLGRGYQVPQVFDSLTVHENLEVASARGGRSPRADAVRKAADLVDLADLLGHAAKDLSGGDRKRVELAILVAQGARVLVLDEPMAGMSSAETDRASSTIRTLTGEGVAVLLIEHDMDVVADLATIVSVLNGGMTLFTGGMSDVVNSELVRQVYLGARESTRLAGEPVPGISVSHHDGVEGELPWAK